MADLPRKKNRCWQFTFTSGRDIVVGEVINGFNKKYTAVQSCMVFVLQTNNEWLQVEDEAYIHAGSCVRLRVQFKGPQPCEGPLTLLMDLLGATTHEVEPIELPKGRQPSKPGATKRSRPEERSPTGGGGSDAGYGSHASPPSHRGTSPASSSGSPVVMPPPYGVSNSFMLNSQRSIDSIDWPVIEGGDYRGNSFKVMLGEGGSVREDSFQQLVAAGSMSTISSSFNLEEGQHVMSHPPRCAMEGLPASQGRLLFSDALTALLLSEGEQQVQVLFGVDASHWTSRPGGPLTPKPDGGGYVAVEFPSMSEIFPDIHQIGNIILVIVDIVVQIKCVGPAAGGNALSPSRDTNGSGSLECPRQFVGPLLAVEYNRCYNDDETLPMGRGSGNIMNAGSGGSSRGRNRRPHSIVDNADAPEASFLCLGPCIDGLGAVEDLWRNFVGGSGDRGGGSSSGVGTGMDTTL